MLIAPIAITSWTRDRKQDAFRLDTIITYPECIILPTEGEYAARSNSYTSKLSSLFTTIRYNIDGSI